MAGQAKAFPWIAGSPNYNNSFRQNVVDFLKAYGSHVPLKLKLTTVWVVPLRCKSSNVKLHVYEERLDESSDTPPICDQCRNMGECR